MFAYDTRFIPLGKPKPRAPSLASFLIFNAKQSKHYDLGYFGEILAIAMLEDAGFKAWKPKERCVGDILAVNRSTGEAFSFEVKTSRFSEVSKSWQFCLNKGKNTCVSHAAQVILILVAETAIFTYLIPSVILKNDKQLLIKSHPERYRGKAAPYRVRGLLSPELANETYQISLLN